MTARLWLILAAGIAIALILIVVLSVMAGRLAAGWVL